MTKNQSDFIIRYCREHKTSEEWAVEFKVARGTIEVWKTKFAKEINTEREKVRQSYLERLEQLVDLALTGLKELAAHKNPIVRHKAIESILSRIVPTKTENKTKLEGSLEAVVKQAITNEDIIEYAEHLQKTAGTDTGAQGVD